MRREGGKGGLGFVLRFLLGLEESLAKLRRASEATRERNERSKEAERPGAWRSRSGGMGIVKGFTP